MLTCPYLHVCLLGTFASVTMNACICTEVTTTLVQGATYSHSRKNPDPTAGRTEGRNQ